MEKPPSPRGASVKFIFATIFLDALGIGIVIPILPDLIRRFSSDQTFISQYYGYFIAVYALMQFLASPVLGAVSDRFGRRPILLCSLLGAGLDYLVMAYAPNLVILFIGRVIAGLTGASHTVATAYMADISDDSNRSKNFGMIGAGWGLGFIVGPVIGGLIGQVGPHAAFIAAAVLNILNFLFGLFVLPESLAPENRRAIQVTRLNPFKSLAKVVVPSPISSLIWVYVLVFLAGGVHPANWTLFTQYKFGWSSLEVGLSLSAIGLLIAICQGGLTGVVIPKIGETKALHFGLALTILAFAATAVVTQSWMIYAFMIPSALGGIANPALQSLISRQVPASEQGEFQGTLVSLASLTAFVGPILYSSLFAYFTSSAAPFQFAGAAYLGAALIAGLGLLLSFKKPPQRLG
jgi:DHA1 family tetracycline resistance protein-like MFS transporter